MLNILWFSLSPCGSMRRNGSKRVIQGWMISLEDELKKQPNVKLSVAYFSEDREAPFVYDRVVYYPMYIPTRKNKIGHVLDRWRSPEKLDTLLLPKMLDVVAKASPDVVHIHGTEERFGLIQDYLKDVPILFSIQGLIAPYAEKFFSGISYFDARKFESLSDKLRKVSIKDAYDSFCFRAKRERHFLQYARYIAGRTFWDENVTLALNPKRTFYHVDEILREPFYKKIWTKSHFSNKIRIVSTISDGIYKGFETVLKTTALLKKYADFDFEWSIVGYDKSAKWVKIASKITGLDPNEQNIRFEGRLDDEELSDLLISSDIYSHVSHIENSPNSVCEAMLVGMPVIASYAGGTGSLLKDEHEGKLVQDGDPYVLAGAITDFFHDFNKARMFGHNARLHALIRHNPQRIVHELLSTYESIIKRSTN